MSAEGRVTCDKCKESYPLKLEMVSRETFHALLPSGFDRIDKMLRLPGEKHSDGTPKTVLKRFIVCGKCIAEHRRQSEALFETHFESLK